MSFYLAMTLLAIVMQGCFAFFEMACVSFSKVRLQYYVSKNVKRAIWLNYLLQRPSRLFGTTLIGVTGSLMIGSECARRFYESLSLSPELAPLSQVPLVVIFAELVPLFAARKHPEQAAMGLVRFMIVIAKILSPVIWILDKLSSLIHKLLGKAGEPPHFLSHEEVRYAFEERDGAQDEFHGAATQIFKLKNLNAGHLMVPLSQVFLAPSHMLLPDLRRALKETYHPVIPVYHRQQQNIVAIVQVRDLLKLEDSKKIIDAGRSPWFVAEETSALQLLKQFRRNNQSHAIVLNRSGHAIGMAPLEKILAHIFGEEGKQLHEVMGYIERTLSGEMPVSKFNQQFGAHLDETHATLNDLVLNHLGHLPVKGEVLKLHDFEFHVEEPSMLGIKTLLVRSIQE